jgi:uncharacterized protein (UPF0128 family)
MNIYLRAIEVMLMSIDKRIDDESLAPKPYEMTPAEMRDLMRLARQTTPLTREGRLAFQQAKGERS